MGHTAISTPMDRRIAEAQQDCPATATLTYDVRGVDPNLKPPVYSFEAIFGIAHFD